MVLGLDQNKVKHIYSVIHGQPVPAKKWESGVHEIPLNVIDVIKSIKIKHLDSIIFTIFFNEIGRDSENVG